MKITRTEALRIIFDTRSRMLSVQKPNSQITAYAQKISNTNDTEDSPVYEQVEYDYEGVGNGFLSELIFGILGIKLEVLGMVEPLLACPCCGYLTLPEIYDVNLGTGYEICRHCGWEDDGTKDITSIRSINKSSIENRRKNLHTNANYYCYEKWLKDNQHD